MLSTGGCYVLSVNAIVIDPEVPEEPRLWLTEADRRRREPRQPDVPVGTYTFRHARVSVYRREDDREYGLRVPELIPFADPESRLDPPTLLSTIAWALFPRLRDHYELDNAAAVYHRRYVCPPQDMDAEARQTWQRTVLAANKTARSDVVRQQLIDSVRVTTVLPYHLWDIAERLARVSALRSSHRDILAGVAADDPDVAVVLEPQRKAHSLAVADIERRVRDLEVFASRVMEADAAKRREEAVRRLADLNDVHRDLVARVGGGSDLPETHDVQAVIDQANKAVRAANEAGRSLALLSRGYAPISRGVQVEQAAALGCVSGMRSQPPASGGYSAARCSRCRSSCRSGAWHRPAAIRR
jgi:hypothetical protein